MSEQFTPEPTGVQLSDGTVVSPDDSMEHFAAAVEALYDRIEDSFGVGGLESVDVETTYGEDDKIPRGVYTIRFSRRVSVERLADVLFSDDRFQDIITFTVRYEPGDFSAVDGHEPDTTIVTFDCYQTGIVEAGSDE